MKITPLRMALDQTIEQGNIDIWLPTFLSTNFLMVCYRDPDSPSPPIFLAPDESEEDKQEDNPLGLYVTIGENLKALGDIAEQEHLQLVSITGQELLQNIVNDTRHKIAVMFDDGALFMIPRDNIDWWLSNYVSH